MAIIRAATSAREAWQPADRLQLLIGDEGADASDPQVSLDVVSEADAHAEVAGTRRVAEHEHIADDVCAVMPVAKRVIDAAGNVSDQIVSFAQLNDAPRGARNVSVAAGGNGAMLGWGLSEHVEGTS